MKVMMPGEDVVARYACRSHGSKHPPADMPSRFTCLLHGYIFERDQ
jgi:hypothetical protein